MGTLDELAKQSQKDLGEERALYRQLLARLNNPQPGDAQILGEVMRALKLVKKTPDGRETNDPDLNRAREDAGKIETLVSAQQHYEHCLQFQHPAEEVEAAKKALDEYTETARLEIQRLQSVFNRLVGENDSITNAQLNIAAARQDARHIGYATAPADDQFRHTQTLSDPAAAHRDVTDLIRR
jgi:hypothetical protein